MVGPELVSPFSIFNSSDWSNLVESGINRNYEYVRSEFSFGSFENIRLLSTLLVPIFKTFRRKVLSNISTDFNNNNWNPQVAAAFCVSVRKRYGNICVSLSFSIVSSATPLPIFKFRPAHCYIFDDRISNLSGSVILSSFG